MSALVAHSVAVQRNAPTLLAGSVHARVARVLRHRDIVHAALRVPQNNEIADRAIEALDTLLFNLVGAFDAAARAAHLCVGLPAEKRRGAAWQRDGWRNRLRENAPELATMFDAGSPQRRILDICTTLRNTVHGEALQSLAVQGGSSRETLVELPEDDAHDLVELMRAAGTEPTWGIREVAGRTPRVEPAALAERLVPAAVSALDDALRLTPVERLPGVSAETLRIDAPDSVEFGAGTQARLRLLVGIPG
jgi:hypothetical protein